MEVEALKSALGEMCAAEQAVRDAARQAVTRSGLSLREIAAYVGTSHQTIKRWADSSH